MFNTKMLASKRMDWKTPSALYSSLDAQFHFDFDPCPSKPTFDGLNTEWKNSNYVNPPYGTQIKYWIIKAWIEAQKGKIVVMLIPSRTDTQYWHDYIMKAHEIWFVKGRLKFDDQAKPAPFPSAIIVFRGKQEDFAYPSIKSVNTTAEVI